MSREATLILVGILVAISPFSGLPRSWLAVILPFLGLVTIGIGYAMRHEQVKVKRLEEPAMIMVAPSTAELPALAPETVHSHQPAHHPGPSRVS